MAPTTTSSAWSDRSHSFPPERHRLPPAPKASFPPDVFDALRILSPLIHPVGLLWCLMLIGALLCARRRQTLGAVFLASLAATLWILCQPIVLRAISLPLEGPWRSHTLEHAPAHTDAIVILGGGWSDSPQDFLGLDLTDQADRWSTGLELARRGVSRHLVLGGDPPTSRSQPILPARSDRLAEWIHRWFPGQFTVHSLGPVRTTRDEARATRLLAQTNGWSRLVLVTSAIHMSRASAAFVTEGVEVQPVACDFQSDPEIPLVASFIAVPAEEPLVRFARAWHEWIGHAVYRGFGFVPPRSKVTVKPPEVSLPSPPDP